MPNWAEDLYKMVPADPAFAEAEGMAGKWNLLFAGNMGAA